MTAEESTPALTPEDSMRETQQEAIDELKGTKLFANLEDKPLKVHSIDIKGLDKTSPHIVEREADRLRNANNFQELERELEDLYLNLINLDVFKAVSLETSESRLGDAESCDVLVRVHEKSAPFFHLGLATTGEAELYGGLQNYFGHAERITASLNAQKGLSQLSTSRAEASAKIFKPRIGGSNVDLEIDVGNSIADRLKASSYSEEQKGLTAKLLWDQADPTISYEVHYGLSRHHLRTKQYSTSLGILSALGLSSSPASNQNGARNSSSKPSHAIVEQMGEYLNSTIGFRIVKSFINSSNPETYAQLRFKSEIAGLWPDERVLRHYKQEFQAEGVWSPKLGSPFSIAGNLRLGFLQPWDQSKTTFLPSRFALGGMITKMRGFKENSIGEVSPRPQSSITDREQTDYLGGDLMAAATISGRFRVGGILPLFRASPAYAHIFGTVGQNSLLQRKSVSQRLKEIKTALPHNLSYSYGAGFVVPLESTGQISLEIGLASTNRSPSKIPQEFYFGFNLGQ